MNFFEDRLAFCGSFIGLRIGVALDEIGVDIVDEFLHRGEATRSDHVLGEIAKEPFGQID